MINGFLKMILKELVLKGYIDGKIVFIFKIEDLETDNSTWMTMSNYFLNVKVSLKNYKS